MDICYHICVLFFCSNSACPAWYNFFVCQQILPAIGISADLLEEKHDRSKAEYGRFASESGRSMQIHFPTHSFNPDSPLDYLPPSSSLPFLPR